MESTSMAVTDHTSKNFLHKLAMILSDSGM